MTMVIGSKLGPYEIVAPLGGAGMGEVYRLLCHHVACPEKSGLIVAPVQKTFCGVLEPSRTTR